MDGARGMKSAKEKWWEYHCANPQVWEKFVDYTFELIQAGHSRGSSKSVFERIRWHSQIETTGTQFKLQNDHTPYYARLFHARYPRHEGFFELREVKENENAM